MKATSAIVAFALVSLGAEGLAAGGKAWRNATWGMTEKQVLRAFKDEAVRLDKPDHYKRGTATIGIPHFSLDEHDFVVRFGFAKGRLSLVNLSHKATATTGGVEFDSLRHMLTEKYGRPLLDEEGSISKKATWKTADTVIDLELSTLTYLVIVHYSPVESEENEKL